MKLTIKSLFFVWVMAILLSACNQTPCGINKNYFLTNFDTFVNDIKDQDLPYNDPDWVENDKKFTRFKDECFENFKGEMTKDEKEEYYTNAAKYYWLRYGSGFVNQVLDEDSEIVENLLESLRDAWNGTENDVNGIINELRDEVDKIDKEKLEDLIKDIGGDMEEWGKKIEEVFKDVEININEEKKK